ncbi:MAG: hypothetical protein AABZ53_15040 [Planctomycetota bacterium]
MRRPLIIKLIAILCLLSFGMKVMAGAHLVHCTDGSGVSHLEWGGCERDAVGRCEGSCESAGHEGEDDATPEPCKDTLVRNELGAAARSASLLTLVGLPPWEWVILPGSSEPPALGMLMREVERRAAAPPPALASIRSIVMLV